VQDPTIVVAVQPWLVSVPVGGTSEVHIGIENPTDLIAFEIQLSFDPTVIQINDDDPERPGVQVGLGSLLNGHDYFAGANAVDNEAGTIDVAVTLMGAGSPINENGDLVVVLVGGKANGASPLALTRVDLIDAHLNPLPANLIDGVIVVGGEIAVTPSPTATFTGTPSPTASPTPTATEIAASATPTPTATASGTPTEIPASSTPTPTPIGTMTPSPTPAFINRVQLPLVLRSF
jgi:cell division septation protein DedD